jgi:diadenosine tetraphosphatase ApaH/serine/threonine PP2A family protein phosphatase
LSIHEKNIKVELKANYDLSFFNIMIFITSCWWWNSKPPHFKRKRKSTFLLFIVFPVVLAGDTLWHLQKFLQCIKYIIFEFTPFTILLYPSPFPDSWNSFNRYQFCICMHVYAFFFFFDGTGVFTLLLEPLLQSIFLWFASPILEMKSHRLFAQVVLQKQFCF